MTTTVAEMITQARSTIECLSPAVARAEHEAEGSLFVDLREADELLLNGSIPGSHHAPRGMLEFFADPTSAYHRPDFDPSRRVVLFCASGGRSALAAVALTEIGYENVAHLEGGLVAWKAAGYPVELPVAAIT
jgi:rhodanese-related sulfurtransferase